MKSIRRIPLTAGEELQLLEPEPGGRAPRLLYDLETGRAERVRPFSRLELIRISLYCAAAWVIAGGVAAVIYLYGFTAIAWAVFGLMFVVAGLGLVDTLRSIRRLIGRRRR